MDSLKDAGGFFALLVVHVAGWMTGASALFGILPIPHSPHDWGLMVGSAILWVWGRYRNRRKLRTRAAARRATPGHSLQGGSEQDKIPPVVTAQPRPARRVAPRKAKKPMKVVKLVRP